MPGFFPDLTPDPRQAADAALACAFEHRLPRVAALAYAAWATWVKADNGDRRDHEKAVREATMRAYEHSITDEAWVIGTLRTLGAPDLIAKIL